MLSLQQKTDKLNCRDYSERTEGLHIKEMMLPSSASSSKFILKYNM